jgi:putative photosynthetic complex assembly protein
MSSTSGTTDASGARTQTHRRPRPLAAFAVVLMLAALIATIAIERQQAAPAALPGSAEIRQLRVLRFDDGLDGSVSAIDVGNGQLVQRFEGEQGFLRGTLRAMARERRLHGLGAGQPFELILLNDGRLTLHDPATGMRIALESFGSTNTGVFARLLN